ncbi:hypothetical protein PPACK8108_LOCUS18115 [Phakopsora pachyrhizi]|uniref:HTH CENPB-type domain-containing protein n=1 Tax=Phakopsora pachyrhizi TaxID=170000 RepID=A0AAV0BCX5_PHAPC|nr:hypothetical protein PPACK8108_LOCUS18115 [Phakopsora pachyrhizi]
MSWDWFSQFRKLHRPILELQPRGSFCLQGNINMTKRHSQMLFEQQDVTNFIEGTRNVLNQEMNIREQVEIILGKMGLIEAEDWLSRTEGDEAAEERRVLVIVSG